MSILPRRFHPIGSSSPQFTRRHYIWLTGAMQEILIEVEKTKRFYQIETIKRGIENFADILATDNPRFNKEQFLTAIFNPEQNSEPKQ